MRVPPSRTRRAARAALLMREGYGAPLRAGARRPLIGSAGLNLFPEGGAENLAFEGWRVRADGVAGNSPFYDGHTVVIDLPRRRVGVLKSPRGG